MGDEVDSTLSSSKNLLRKGLASVLDSDVDGTNPVALKECAVLTERPLK